MCLIFYMSKISSSNEDLFAIGKPLASSTYLTFKFFCMYWLTIVWTWVCGSLSESWHMWGGQRTPCGSRFSSFFTWVKEITMLGRKSLYPLDYSVSPKSIGFWDRVSSSPDGLRFAVYSRITKVFIQVLPSPSPKYCDYRHRPSRLLLSSGGARTQGVVHTEQALYQLSYIS